MIQLIIKFTLITQFIICDPFNGFRIITEALNVVVDDVILIIMTGCPLDLMKFVAAKSVEIPEGKVIWLVL